MDDRTVDLIFAGSLESLPPVSSKIVRIFTSSTFTGKTIINNLLCMKTKSNYISAYYTSRYDNGKEYFNGKMLPSNQRLLS